MAIRMQQRRGTAAQWVSSNAGAGPILNAGEIGWESDTNKFKIGDGTNNWSTLTYFVDATDVIAASLTGYALLSDVGAVSGIAGLNADQNVKTKTAIEFEGATADSFETFVVVTDPTADRTITLPDATGTVALTSDITVTASSTNTLTNKSISLGSNTVTSTLAQLNTAVTDADVASLAGSETLTNKTLTSPVINTPTGITKTDVGLANVDNTTDANKPVSTATQTALDLKANLAAPALTGDATAVNLTISGNLTVNGTTTNLNSTNLVVEDKNIILADVETPTDTTANGGGITLKGATDKTLNWVDATDAWTSSEDFNLLTGKVYEIAGTSVLSGTTLGSGVTGSSLTSVGTITSGTWTGTAIAVANGGTGSTSAGDARTALGLAIGTDVQAYNSTLAAVAGGTYTGDDSITTLGTITAGTWTGTTIAIANGGTGQTTAMTAATALLPDQASNSGKYLTTDGSGTLSWGTVSGYSAPTLGSTSIASGATVTTIEGLTLTSPVLTTPSISTIDAVGDLLIGTADNTIGKISIGANGYLLTSNGTTASWQAAAPSGAAFSELMLIGA
jgi:hypothetical protein